jgi:hypothetical protein
MKFIPILLVVGGLFHLSGCVRRPPFFSFRRRREFLHLHMGPRERPFFLARTFFGSGPPVGNCGRFSIWASGRSNAPCRHRASVHDACTLAFLSGHKSRLAVRVTVEFASNIFNSRADPFHRSDNFICWHVEAFGPIPQFVIFIWVNSLALRCRPCLCHHHSLTLGRGHRWPHGGPSHRHWSRGATGGRKPLNQLHTAMRRS